MARSGLSCSLEKRSLHEDLPRTRERDPAECDRQHSTDTLTLLSPHSQQIEHLEFLETYWRNIIEFSKDNSGPFPLLRTLQVNPAEFFGVVGAPPSTLLLRSAINLKEFVFDLSMVQYLNHFVFPNLTIFELTSSPEGFDASTLLDFLKASPMLQTVQMRINANIIPENIPRELVVLSHVNTFHLVLENGTGLHDIVAHISCPNATHTSLHSEMDGGSMAPELENFPTSISWNPIVQQYTTDPVGDVALKISIRPGRDPVVTCSLDFRCPGKSVVTLCCEIFDAGADSEDLETYSIEGIGCKVFRQALRTICDHPLIPNVKFLQISSMGMITELDDDYLESIGNEFGRLFMSLGPLDTLSIDGYDPRLYLASFLDLPELLRIQRCTAYPPIKELKISHPAILHRRKECRGAVVELARSQHVRGVPFERVTINMEGLPAAMVGALKSWVGVVNDE